MTDSQESSAVPNGDDRRIDSNVSSMEEDNGTVIPRHWSGDLSTGNDNVACMEYDESNVSNDMSGCGTVTMNCHASSGNGDAYGQSGHSSVFPDMESLVCNGTISDVRYRLCLLFLIGCFVSLSVFSGLFAYDAFNRRNVLRSSVSYDAELAESMDASKDRYADPSMKYRDGVSQYGPEAQKRERMLTEAEAELAGATVDWDIENSWKHCTRPDGRKNLLNGEYCSATPDVIYLNEDVKNYSSKLRSGYMASTLRHELAHRAITKICGTVNPPVTNGRPEGVATAYAVLFYHADMFSLMVGHGKEYQIRGHDFDAARSIHSGECKVITTE